jgi:hypothetical protein
MNKYLLILVCTFSLIPNLAFAQVTGSDQVETEDLSDINSTIDKILPSQSDLFDNSKRLDKNNDGTVDEDEQLRLIEGDLEQEVAPRIIRILVGFSSLGFTVLFTYAGVKLLLSRGNEEELTKAKDLLIHVIIGTAVLLGSFAIIVGVLRFFNSI